ncbi:hypothetical protein ACRJ4W_30385 [Streptomyces sp. GLT-R25]
MTVTQQGAAVVPPSRSTLRRLPLSARQLPHLVFLAVVVGTLARLITVHTWLCWVVAPPIVVLALVYVGGLMRWDRLGTWGKPAWLALLLLLWGCVCWILPADLTTGYVWLAVPLAVVAQRMPGRRLPLAALWVTTVVLVVDSRPDQGRVRPRTRRTADRGRLGDRGPAPHPGPADA